VTETYDPLDQKLLQDDPTDSCPGRLAVTTGDALDKSIDDSMTSYGIDKPRRITFRGRITHDLGRNEHA
jgi:hypothetical protein